MLGHWETSWISTNSHRIASACRKQTRIKYFILLALLAVSLGLHVVKRLTKSDGTSPLLAIGPRRNNPKSQFLRNQGSLEHQQLAHPSAHEELSERSRNTRNSPFFKFILDDPDVACNHYDLPVDDPEMISFIKKSKPLNCGPTAVIDVSGDVIFVKGEALSQVVCNFTELYRQDDHSYLTLKTIDMDGDGRYRLKYGDTAQVQCYNLTSKKRWSEVHLGVRKLDHIANVTGWNKLPAGAIPLNILIWMFDSTSTNNFMRKMVHSWNFIKHSMNGLLMDGHNAVEEHTFYALSSILTGYYNFSYTADSYIEDTMTAETIFELFSKLGYVTTFLEDQQQYGTFQHWGAGFRNQPTDHYNRPYMWERGVISNWVPAKCCFGRSCNSVVQQFTQQFWETYKDKPKLALVLQGEYSHGDINELDLVDLEFLSMLQWMNDPSVAENTMLIIMGDHGHRSSRMTFTRQGKMEFRRPFLYIALPKWMEQTWPLPAMNLRTNSKRLVTAMDLYYTMKDLLSFEKEDFSIMPSAENLPWGLSMFKPMPKGRTCAMAGIDDLFCGCHRYQEVDMANDEYAELMFWLGNVTIRYLNRVVNEGLAKCVDDLASKQQMELKVTTNSSLLARIQTANRPSSNGRLQTLCKPWRLKRVEQAMYIVPSSQVQKSNGKPEDAVYEIAFVASPGESHFVATVKVDSKFLNLELEEAYIVRLDWYSLYSKCIEEICPKLQKFCHCGNVSPQYQLEQAFDGDFMNTSDKDVLPSLI